MNHNDIPTYIVKLGEDDEDNSGIYAMSLVTAPAVNRSWIALEEQKQLITLAKHPTEQIITGAFLVPDLKIYREDKKGNPYYIVYQEEDIKKIFMKFMKNQYLNKTTVEHKGDVLKDNYLIEAWLVANPDCDKSVALGLSKLPKGSACASYYCPDKEFFDSQIVNGTLSGFSLEGFFDLEKIEMSINKIENKDTKMSQKKKTIRQILQRAFAKVTLTTYELDNGSTLEVDDITGEALIDGDMAEDGDYTTIDGDTISVVDGYADVEMRKAKEALAVDAPATPEATTVEEAKPTVLEDGDYTTSTGVMFSIKDGEVIDNEVDETMTDEMDMMKTQMSELEVKLAEQVKTIETLNETIKSLNKKSATVSLKKTISDEEIVDVKMSVTDRLKSMKIGK